jgi:hypothetical protein
MICHLLSQLMRTYLWLWSCNKHFGFGSNLVLSTDSSRVSSSLVYFRNFRSLRFRCLIILLILEFISLDYIGFYAFRGSQMKMWYESVYKNKQDVLERTNLPTFLTLFKNVICIKTSVCPSITLVGNSVSILKLSHIKNNVSNKRIVGSPWSFIILNFNSVGLIHLRRKLNSLQRYDIAQNYRILHRVVQCLSQHDLKISHHRHI